MIRSFFAVPLAFALSGIASAQQYLIMPDSTNNRLVSFSVVDGSSINSNLFALQLGTPISAVQVGAEIWVSEQSADRVSRWDSNGVLLGNIGGQFAGGGLDNIRGAAMIGNVYHVTCSGVNNGAPGDAIVRYDTAGNSLGSFSTTGFAPSPFAILDFQGDLLVSSSSGNDDIHRFTSAGASISTFHNSSTILFGHQMAIAANGDVLCAGFTSNNVTRLDPVGGTVLSTFTASGARGVYQLANGNILWSNASGVHVYDVSTSTSASVYSGGGRHFSLFSAGAGSPVVYCTSGTSTNGCAAAISATAQPSVTSANPCQIDVANVEGLKLGLIFYSVDNTGFTPLNWGTGTSFLCVKSPTQRSATQSAGGTAGLCDGSFTLDWNAYQAANPTSLGNPFVTGSKVFAQAWYRDPPAPKTTNLSNAVEMTYVP